MLLIVGFAPGLGGRTGTAVAADEAPLEATPVIVPPYFARLFVEEQTFWYSVVDDHVSDHSDRFVDRFRYLCTVVEVRRFRGAVASQMECSYVSPVDRQVSDDVRETVAFICAPGGLWMTAAMPTTQQEVATTLLEPPSVPDVPVTSSRTFERPAGGDRVDRCKQRVEAATHTVCRDDRCEVTDGWGDTRERVCFTRGRGLESYRRENVTGAGSETWRLQRIGPVPVSSHQPKRN